MMAEFVEDLVAQLVADGHGTAGTDIFQDMMPEAPDTCLSVRSAPGAPSESQFATDTLYLERPRAVIWVRAGREDAATARTNAHAAYKDLGKVLAETVNGTLYHRLIMLQPPFKLRDDDQGRPVFAFNVEAEKRVA